MLFMISLWTFLRALLSGSAAIALENVALRHQLRVLQRSVRRPRLALSFPRRFPPGDSQKDSPTPGARPSVLFYPVMFRSARVENGLRGAAPRTARA